MEVVQLGPGFAAELRGIDLLDAVSNGGAYHDVREAFEEHSVIVFREQTVTDDVQVAFTRAFGPLELTRAGLLGTGSLCARITNIGPDGTLVPPTHQQAVINRADQLWHTDSSFKKTPALASVLSARIIPEHGGETQFTSTRSAWNRLSDAQKEELRDLIVVHSYANSRDQIDPSSLTPEERAALLPVRRRMTWKNPANGREALYIASHAAEIEGMEMNEGKALLARLIDDATQTPTTYLHRWRVGDVVMWDNRAVMHRGRPWSDTQARLMIRTIVSASDADGLALLRSQGVAASEKPQERRSMYG